ncbi:MAG: DUF1573 domain-containing protein [Tidjanibacter sp.]|nr:DUF1573 domain-containing protein [Tidjanibacter sp.]
MRRVSILLVALLVCLGALSQEPAEGTSLLFDATEWNFGEIDEVNGVVSHTFHYRNTSEGFVQIERVYSSCGCTSGEYSRRPLKPNGEGLFTVTFDPAGRGGKVDKEIILTYNKGSEKTTLRVRGKVNPRPLTPEELYPYELAGGVRSDSSFKAFGKVAVGRTKSMTIALVNTSAEELEVAIEWEKQSGALEINEPFYLSPNEKALVTVTYAPTVENTAQSKLLIDEFRFVVGGTPSEMLFRTSAVAEEKHKKEKTTKQ